LFEKDGKFAVSFQFQRLSVGTGVIVQAMDGIVVSTDVKCQGIALGIKDVSIIKADIMDRSSPRAGIIVIAKKL
jgi:hypothetical protein